MDEHSTVEVEVVEEFERLGRRAGAELRQPPPDDGPGTVLRSAHRRRTTTAVVAAGVTVAVAATGLFVASSRIQDEPVPIATEPPSSAPIATVPSTSVPAALAAGPFEGSWVSVDTDGSTQMMEIVGTGGDDYEFVLRDDSATACSGVPASMTGAGRLESDQRLVLAQAELNCDDGTIPRIGLAPQAALANLAFDLDTTTDQLTDSFGVVWQRAGSTQEPAAPSPGTDPMSSAATSGEMWPQSTLEEVLAAQELADAGEPD